MLKIFRITVVIFIFFLAGFVLSTKLYSSKKSPFFSLSPDEMYREIISERDYAIGQAVKRGDYKCCIKPPCTMCYMEANQWNNYKAGTCACDDLIAQGKEPCPQCRNGLCKEEEKTFCEGN